MSDTYGLVDALSTRCLPSEGSRLDPSSAGAVFEGRWNNCTPGGPRQPIVCKAKPDAGPDGGSRKLCTVSV